jgi:hypothetical protein
MMLSENAEMARAPTRGLVIEGSLLADVSDHTFVQRVVGFLDALLVHMNS